MTSGQTIVSAWRAAIDERGLGSPQRVGPVCSRIEADFVDPTSYDSCTLTRREMRRSMKSARKQKFVRMQTGTSNPGGKNLAGFLCNLKLHRPSRLLLHGSQGHTIPVRNVPDAKLHQITRAKFAIDVE